MKISLSIFLCLLLLGCSNLAGPKENNNLKTHSSQNRIVSVNSYDIPKGIFRGVLWPSQDAAYFEPWIIRNNQEIFFKIPAPPEVAKWESDVTDEWIIKENKAKKNTREYVITRIDQSKSLNIELPKKNRNYSFYILTTKHNEDIVIFMDIDENVSDTGLFGYIVII